MDADELRQVPSKLYKVIANVIKKLYRKQLRTMPGMQIDSSGSKSKFTVTMI